MSKQKWINLVSAYSIIYTVITLLYSVLYLCNGAPWRASRDLTITLINC